MAAGESGRIANARATNSPAYGSCGQSMVLAVGSLCNSGQYTQGRVLNDRTRGYSLSDAPYFDGLKGCTHCAIKCLRRPAMALTIWNRNEASHSGDTYLCEIKGYRWARNILKCAKIVFDNYLTCHIFPVYWARFPVQNSYIAQWVHLFSMNLRDIFDNLS